MGGWMSGWIGGWMDQWINGRMNELADGWAAIFISISYNSPDSS